ncbi:MAG: SURF1 family protein [Porticoccaceae bacterium]|nr:SURF1 family protein [Porticoccaceae bacterium]
MTTDPQLPVDKFCWQPNVKLALLVAFLLPSLIVLGFWQLSRADEKRAIVAHFDRNQQSKPALVGDLSGTADMQYRLAWLRGELDPKRRIFLDNRVRHNRPGYEVLEVLTLEDSGVRVLVNRGWVAAPLDRNKLSTVVSVSGSAQFRGFLYRNLPGSFILDDGVTVPDDWPVRLGWISVERASAVFQQLFYDYQLRLDRDSPGALETGWPTVAVQPEKHTAYAVQWFTMAAVLVVMAVSAMSNLTSWLAAFLQRVQNER